MVDAEAEVQVLVEEEGEAVDGEEGGGAVEVRVGEIGGDGAVGLRVVEIGGGGGEVVEAEERWPGEMAQLQELLGEAWQRAPDLTTCTVSGLIRDSCPHCTTRAILMNTRVNNQGSPILSSLSTCHFQKCF